GAPNYFPNSFSGPMDDVAKYSPSQFTVSGDCARYNSADDDNFTQVTTFWTKVLNDEERMRLVKNIAGHVKDAKDFIQKRCVQQFTKVHPDFGNGIARELQKHQVSG
ncbi:predicted protein, partial [Nematostella vectensis]